MADALSDVEVANASASSTLNSPPSSDNNNDSNTITVVKSNPCSNLMGRFEWFWIRHGLLFPSEKREIAFFGWRTTRANKCNKAVIILFGIGCWAAVFLTFLDLTDVTTILFGTSAFQVRLQIVVAKSKSLHWL